MLYRGSPIDKDGGIYSALQVLHAHHKWYIGRLFNSHDGTMAGIGTRESEFYDSREEAEKALVNGEFNRDSEELLKLYE